MRKKRQIQMPLLITDIDHPKATELRRISHILDQYPIISRMVWQDLSGSVSNPAKWAYGMSAEQVLRAAIINRSSSSVTRSCLSHHGLPLLTELLQYRY